MPRKKNLALEIEQPTICSCGPTALAVSLMELAVDDFVFEYNTRFGLEQQRFQKDKLFWNQTKQFPKTNQCNIYDKFIIKKIHSACSMTKHDSPAIDYSYTVPSGIADCLKFANDICVEVYLSGCVFPKIINHLYPDEEKNLKYLKIDVKRTKPPKLRDNQRMVSIVIVTQVQSSIFSLYDTLRQCNRQKLEGPILGLHIVLTRPDTNRYRCMEPGVGKNYANFWQASGGLFGNLWQLGVDIVITKT